MLEIENLNVAYGKAVAVRSVSFTHHGEETLAIVGPNGAGKSSVGQAVAGVLPARMRLRHNGTDVTSLDSRGRVRRGIVYVPEGRRVFPHLTVHDNLRAGAFTRRRSSLWRQRYDEVLATLPQLRERLKVHAGLLSGGEQQLLAISRALMTMPEILILDEPSLGLSPSAIVTVTDFLRDLACEWGMSLLILEQNLAFAASLATRAVVMQLGELTDELDSESLREPGSIRTLFGFDDP